MLRTNHILSLKHLAYFKNTFGSSEELTSDKVTSSAVTQSTFKSERKDYSRAIYRIVLFTLSSGLSKLTMERLLNQRGLYRKRARAIMKKTVSSKTMGDDSIDVVSHD